MSEAELVASLFTLLLVGGLFLAAIAATRADLRTVITDTGLALSALVAGGATIGSLYFSERAGFVPCELCWYQRIAMYPQALVLAIAAVRRDVGILRYSLPLAAIGFAIAIYHVQLQIFPDQASMCDITNPCSGRWVRAFGVVTIPQMAALSFALLLLVGGMTLMTRRSDP